MTFVKQYVLTATEDKAADLKSALIALADRVRAIAGSTGVDILLDRDNAGTFVFVEKWASFDAYQEGGKLVGKDAFAPVMAAIGAPPKACSLDLLAD